MCQAEWNIHCSSFHSIESLTFYLSIIPLSEPTQIYRFLRTRNAVAVSRFFYLFYRFKFWKCYGESANGSRGDWAKLNSCPFRWPQVELFAVQKKKSWCNGILSFWRSWYNQSYIKIQCFSARISSSDSLVHEASANSQTGEKTVSVYKYADRDRSFLFLSTYKDWFKLR